MKTLLIISATALVALALAACGSVHHSASAHHCGTGTTWQSGANGSPGCYAAPVAASTPTPSAVPSPNGTYTGSCNYTLGSSPATGTAILVGEIDLTNTGNIGTIDAVAITWPQEGYAPLAMNRTVHSAAGGTTPVSFHMPVNESQISLLQSWQSGHNYSDGCTYKVTITGTYGAAA
jgi:hypothetical protein